jgi:hypothetical protein
MSGGLLGRVLFDFLMGTVSGGRFVGVVWIVWLFEVLGSGVLGFLSGVLWMGDQYDLCVYTPTRRSGDDVEFS